MACPGAPALADGRRGELVGGATDQRFRAGVGDVVGHRVGRVPAERELGQEDDGGAGGRGGQDPRAHHRPMLDRVGVPADLDRPPCTGGVGEACMRAREGSDSAMRLYSWVASAGAPEGCCWVMQWMPPPWAKMSRASTSSTVRPG